MFGTESVLLILGEDGEHPRIEVVLLLLGRTRGAGPPSAATRASSSSSTGTGSSAPARSAARSRWKVSTARNRASSAAVESSWRPSGCIEQVLQEV
jgi:hypothetical protein